MQFLIKFDLQKDFYFSYWCEDRFGVGQKTVYDQMNNIIGNTWYNQHLDLEKLYESIPITIEHDQFVGNDWSAGTDFFHQTSFASFISPKVSVIRTAFSGDMSYFLRIVWILNALFL